MTLKEAIQQRHSVRQYKEQALAKESVLALRNKIEEVNRVGHLHVQLVQNEHKAFSGPMAYGKFSGVSNYLVMAGENSEDLDYRIGYYGEQLVLLAQQLGLNTCWAGLSYRKVKDTFVLEGREKIVCYISLGYGVNQGIDHKRKSPEELSNMEPAAPAWFIEGVEAARLAPTAVNQQKFSFEITEQKSASGKTLVKANKGFSLIGYTKIDLGIAKLHFEIGAGTENFDWCE